MTSNQLAYMANRIAEQNAATNRYDAETRRREQDFSKRAWYTSQIGTGIATLAGSLLGWR